MPRSALICDGAARAGKRVGRPEEIAALASYLAGPQPGYMTGSSLTIDGGYIL
ncbi:SDR family oxidoreductase [Azospirillum thiophilum]|uniref:SDR family oxidoreductase n=1 Tax=Azospirillum thiophilum TaxID=528244 RepID=UPI001910601C|nr:SDR family oxidoreductase [Azospirillum thiophilum]